MHKTAHKANTIYIDKAKFHFASHVTSRHDTFDMSRRACRAVLFDKLDTD